MKKNILITYDSEGRKVVLIPQIIFHGKRTIPWDEVEKYLKQYVGDLFEVAETKDMIYIGSDFPDEYAGSLYTHKLKGAFAKAKANMVQGLPELIKIATNKRWDQDYQKKHGGRAEKGWYRFDTRFALPVADKTNQIIRYNTYSAVLIIRYSLNGKLYLYDIQTIKKSAPIELTQPDVPRT